MLLVLLINRELGTQFAAMDSGVGILKTIMLVPVIRCGSL